ncbi:MAG: hypothetical protein Q8O87_03235 [bacterium]|nr:hypothetical protein [bacterium]
MGSSLEGLSHDKEVLDEDLDELGEAIDLNDPEADNELLEGEVDNY